MRFNPDTVWGIILCSVFVLVVVILGMLILSNHEVMNYYLETHDTPTGGYTCVMGQRQWVPDTTEVCFSDPVSAMKALEILKVIPVKVEIDAY
jgi:hypothetical protein